MKKFLATLLTSTFLILNGLTFIPILSSGSFSVVHAANNDANKAVCEGIGVAGGDCNPGGSNTSESTLNRIITLVVNVLSWVVGVAAVIMIIIAGFTYITSGGNAESTGRAKNMILYAVIGLIIVALAQIIVQFVLKTVTSSSP